MKTGTTLTPQEASTQWHALVDSCYQDEIYDETYECGMCDHKYFRHDGSWNIKCDGYEGSFFDYVNLARLHDGIDKELVALHEATKHIPFSALPKPTLDLEELEVILEWFDGEDDLDLDEVWTWLRGWDDTHK